MNGTRRACPVCANDAGSSLWRQRYALFDDSTLPRATELVACAECAMVYARSSASADDYRAHYARHSKYDTACAASGSGESPLDRARINALVDALEVNRPASASILDIGAGRGGILRAFRERGFSDLTAIDPSPGCVAAMREEGFDAHACDLEAETWPIDPKRFDLIILSHVLEHVFDAAAALRNVVRRLSKAGAIYVEVPDAGRYSTAGFPPYYFLDPEHINHFDEAALCQLAGRCGLRVTHALHRNLDVGSTSSYPAIGVTMVHARADARRAAAETSDETSGKTSVAMGHYLDACAHQTNASRVSESVDRLIRKGRRVVVWGAGSHAQRVFANTSLLEAPIDCLIDSDPGKQGRRLAGHEVVSPELGLQRAKASGAAVAIAIAVGGGAVEAAIRTAMPDAEVWSL